MIAQLLHTFRNTPLGRESFLQSVYFCKMVGCEMIVHIPKFTKFLMYFENDVVQVDLDSSYLNAPDSAVTHALEMINQTGLPHRFLTPKHYTASTLPDIPTNFDFMCCPRSISDLSSKIGLGHIGPRVRRIVRSAKFPVIITSPCYKEWKNIAVFYGGSHNSNKALRLGIHIKRRTGFPLNMFTQHEHEKHAIDTELNKSIEKHVNHWQVFEKGAFEDNLYDVPHDALCIVGAFGHGLIKDMLFGSKMEKIQSTLSNNLLIVGPNYSVSK